MVAKMKKISFDGIEDRIGEEITIVIDIEGRQTTYKQKLVGADREHLIFQEGKSRAYIPKNRIIFYN